MVNIFLKLCHSRVNASYYFFDYEAFEGLLDPNLISFILYGDFGLLYSSLNLTSFNSMSNSCK